MKFLALTCLSSAIATGAAASFRGIGGKPTDFHGHHKVGVAEKVKVDFFGEAL